MEINESRLKELLATEAAQADMGVYPAAVEGGSNSYKKRTDWMEGWNAAGDAMLKKGFAFSAWLKGLDDQSSTHVLTLLLSDSLRLWIGSDDAVVALVNCSDLFYWACADAEEITIEEIPSLLAAYRDSPTHGGSLWCARKRGMRPQQPCYKAFSDAERELFDACGPERDRKDEG